MREVRARLELALLNWAGMPHVALRLQALAALVRIRPQDATVAACVRMGQTHELFGAYMQDVGRDYYASAFRPRRDLALEFVLCDAPALFGCGATACISRQRLAQLAPAFHADYCVPPLARDGAPIAPHAWTLHTRLWEPAPPQDGNNEKPNVPTP